MNIVLRKLGRHCQLFIAITIIFHSLQFLVHCGQLFGHLADLKLDFGAGNVHVLITAGLCGPIGALLSLHLQGQRGKTKLGLKVQPNKRVLFWFDLSKW